MRRTFYTEAAYAIGLAALALGTALMERADFGMSMVVAPAYLVYLKVSEHVSWFTFGMAEYCLQALLIIVLALVLRGFRRRYLFSFITAFIYGNLLDAMMKAVSLIPGSGIGERCAFDISRTKTVYDCCSCLVAVALSFLFIGFGRFEGVKLGTVLCALVNGRLIGWCSRWFCRRFDFVDALGARSCFE